MDLHFIFVLEKFIFPHLNFIIIFEILIIYYIFEISFEDKEVAHARIIASRFDRSKGMAIDSRTFIASTQARWKASEILVGWMPWSKSF